MIKQNYILLTLAFICLIFGGVNAQEKRNSGIENSFFSAIRSNQTDSYMTFSQGLGNMEPLIFEALVSPYFLLRTSIDSRWGATISPAIMIRMYAEESLPVRTPSYMPNISFYHQLKSSKNYRIVYLFLNLTHHSNGQNGSFFNSDGSINTLSGDFSTNFLELGFFFNQNLVPFSNTYEYFKSSIEYHIDANRSAELEGRYSFLRWHNNIRIFRFLGYKTNSKRLLFDKTPAIQTKVETTWMFGEINDTNFFDFSKRFNFSLTFSYRPKFLSDVSFFANFYSGEDYYNMHFHKRITVLRVGLQAFSFK